VKSSGLLSELLSKSLKVIKATAMVALSICYCDGKFVTVPQPGKQPASTA